jgi:lysozyme family protein
MWLQQALRPAYTGRIDGLLGMGTLAALKADKNNDALSIVSATREWPS